MLKASGVLVVSLRNTFHAVLFLISSFFFSVTTVFLLENEFLAFFLIIYLGAIVILFLFVVMMLDFKHNALKQTNLHTLIGIFIGLTSFFYIKSKIDLFQNGFDNNQITKFNFGTYLNWNQLLDQTTDVNALAEVFYRDYITQILIAGILLYIAVIGVVFLTSRKRKKTSIKNAQSSARQLARNNIL